MAETKDLIVAIRDAMSVELSALVQQALDEAAEVMSKQATTSLDGQNLFNNRQASLERFLDSLQVNFDALVVDRAGSTRKLDYSSLSLVQEGDLEAMIAMEGMIAHARNCDIHQSLCFNTRLDSLFFGTRIDESNNPMDPEQIGNAFRDALVPVELSPAALLLAYRSFNKNVFHQLESVLERANEILIAQGVMPDLDIAARQKEAIKGKRSQPRPRIDPVERAFSKEEDWADTGQGAGSHQLFSMMQTLLHGMASAASGGKPGPATVGSGGQPGNGGGLIGGELQTGMLVGGRKVEMLAGDRLLTLLNRLEQSLGSSAAGPADIQSRLGEELESLSDTDTLQAIDRQSTDVINLTNLLYEAIWEDVSVPIPVKELIGRTQITALKLALQDPGFFDSDSHPMRVLINELATAGISWTEAQEIEQDPVYQQMKETVSSLISEYAGDSDYINRLVEQFREFKRGQLLSNQETESKLMDAEERSARMEEVRQYTREKIRERILDPAIPEFVRNFLDTQFHQFLVQVVLREGPGGVSWKPVMNTIDVLLWTVSPERTERDLDRFVKLKTRLLVNLSKALDVAEVPKAEANDALRELQKVQEQAFKPDEPEASSDSDGAELEDFSAWMATAKPASESQLPPLPEEDEHLKRVSKIPIGIWVEFQVDGEQTIRCTLAAKIDTIDKYVFVNSQGVKVIEKSRMGLARELKAGTVKVISQAPLMERAMETVIGKLRATGGN